MTETITNIPEPETTGRFIVTYREGAKAETLAAFKKSAGVGKADMMSSADFTEGGVDMAQISSSGGVVLDNLGIAVINMSNEAVGAMSEDAGADSAILSIEPEGIMYALDEQISSEYLRGFSDSAHAIYAKSQSSATEEEDAAIEALLSDTPVATWGLQATGVLTSQFSGLGVKIAVLDTGLDLLHPDFAGRAIVGRSFIPGVASFQDGHGHGTHCIGTACGRKRPVIGRRYGVASGSKIFVGKVLSDAGSGADGGILAGIDWAVANRCQVISMSLGANTPMTSVAYETAGARALVAGSLIVAAAGNNALRSTGNFGFVGRPANSRSFMAVAAVDSLLKVANFSARDTARAAGTAVDIAGPGVAVYSTWPMPIRYNTISGTSMATPHVAGIAALWAQKTGATGAALWRHLIVNASGLPHGVSDVGRGLVRAP